jgi:hypothetical protein
MPDTLTAAPPATGPRWLALLAWWDVVLPPANLAGTPVPVRISHNTKENDDV